MYIIDKNFDINKTGNLKYSKKMILELPSSKVDSTTFKNIINYSLINEDANPTININEYISNYEKLDALFALFRSSEYNGNIVIPDNGKIQVLHSLFEKAVLNNIYIDVTLLKNVQNINHMFQDCTVSGNVVGLLPGGSFYESKEKKALFPIKRMEGAFCRTFLNKFMFILMNIKPYDNFEAEYAFLGTTYLASASSENTLDLSFMHGGRIIKLFENFNASFINGGNNDSFVIDLSNFDLKTCFRNYGYCQVDNAFAVNLDYRYRDTSQTIVFKLHKNWLLYPDLLKKAIGTGVRSNEVSIIEYNDHILLKMKPIKDLW